MSESPTGDAVVTPASNEEPTGQSAAENQPAEANQETISGEQSQEAVSGNESAQQNENKNEENSGNESTDDGLAKFAKSQGIEDLSELSEREQKFLKIAHDNQKAARSNTNNGPKITDTAKALSPGDDSSRIAALEFKSTTDEFFSQEGRDRALEGTMAEILTDKVKELTPTLGEAEAKKYAFNLSRDLGTLYGMAQLKSGANDPNAAKEQGRREERESIVKKAGASAPQAHAVSSAPSSTKIDSDWIANEYDPSNPEHVKMVQEAMRSDLY